MAFLRPAGAYIEPKATIPGWWIWVYWINPMAWAQQSLAINEFKCALPCGPYVLLTGSEPGVLQSLRCPQKTAIRLIIVCFLLCSAKRWSQYTDPVTGRTVGQQLMLNQSFKTSMGYKWGGLAVVIFSSFLFNALIWLALAALKGQCCAVI